MKYFILSLAAAVMASCTADKEQHTIISGTLTNNSKEVVAINGHDNAFELKVDNEGKFKDTLNISANGYYYFFAGRERTAIYLEKGKTLTISVNTDEFDETLDYSGDLANENNYLAAKYLYNEKNSDLQSLYSKEEAQFKDALTKCNKSYDSLLKAKDVTNTAFLELEKNDIKYAEAGSILNYETYHKYATKNDSFKVSDDFYSSLKDINYKDTLAYKNSEVYRGLVSTHINTLISKKQKEDSTANYSVTYVETVNNEYPNGAIKDNVLTNYLSGYGLRPDEHLEDIYSTYISTNPTKENLEKVNKRYNVMKNIKPGKISPKFSFENIDGTNTSLDDLGGNYLYIDVWATWCGPCIAEIPSLKQVEKDYQGQPVKFVSISIDNEKDKQKWKTIIAEKDLQGIQLFADNNWESKFVQDYGIQGIPRFILIDKEGHIVSADAPRPSNPELRIKLDTLLKS
jgi:thiol-disulfide isomerase/thioredoxin